MATTASRVALGRLAQEAAALAGVVRGSLGPEGGQVLLTRPTGEVLLSRDGRRVLEALNVESPTARMMITCISTHCSLTGDGAKTFIILLSALLQGLERLGKAEFSFCKNIQEREAHEEKCYGLKQISQFLMMIQMHILDHIVIQDLDKQFSSVFSAYDTKISRSAMESVLEAYFCGKVGNNKQKFLSQLSCNYYFKATTGKNQSEVLHLVDEYFAELHTTVVGLPVSSSRILNGLVLHRDFAVYCPADGDKRILIVTEPIQSALSDSGVEVVITASSQYWTSEIWITKRTEIIIKQMQQNNIKVLLSSVKQQETVHYCAKTSGISVVECLSPEEISLICRITGISPFRPSLDSIQCEITEFAVADFCQPLQLGSRRYVHIGLTKTPALQPHCVILCGPVHGVTEQHVCAFHGAFKMLRQMFTAVHLNEGCDPKAQSQYLSKAAHNSKQCTAAQQHFMEESSDSIHDQACGEQRRPCEHDARCRTFHESELDSVDLQRLYQKYNCLRETRRMDKNEFLEYSPNLYTTVENDTSRNILEQLQPSKDNCTGQRPGTLLTHKESNKSNTQSNLNSFIKVGSVVPVGGIFEILLHYYLSYYAKQCQSPNVSILCSLVADVLLNVPKTLCRAQKRNAFPQLYLKVTNALGNTQQLLTNKKSLESVSCKYQLVVSVLHCTARLLSIDLIIRIKRLPQKAEESDSEDDL
ncbi:Bardet-Biedl syndrome 10 protein [Tiliqua scincoides]|uniref:Bardet-Biedl syndrome 10 protein n=1 Tax=Tiliqua scincoides TaxID=71010 RepID=UPI003462B531